MIEVSLLKVLLTYEPETGKLLWNRRPREMFASRRAFSTWNARYAGRIAGSDRGDGYHSLALKSFGRQKEYVHRVIWALMTGSWPPETIDHVNGNPADNRWTNLRLATYQEQRFNEAVRNFTVGVKGVEFDSRYREPYRARIKKDRRQIELGRFSTAQAAHAAYVSAANELFGEYACDGRRG